MHAFRAPRAIVLLLSFVLCISTAPAQEPPAAPQHSPSDLAVKDDRRRSCFSPGRRVQCTFTVTFDARTEEFTEIEGVRTHGNEDAVKRSLPVDRHSLPILTGDILVVVVENLPLNDRIEAGATAKEVDPFPRPALNETLALSSLPLSSFATQELAALIEASGTDVQVQKGETVQPWDFLRSPEDFARLWSNSVKDHLRRYTDDLQKQVDGLTPVVERSLVARGQTLADAESGVTGRIRELAHDLEAAMDSLQACAPVDNKTPPGCLAALHVASALAQRQAALQNSVRQLIETVDLKTAGETAAKVVAVLDLTASREIMRNNLDVVEKLAALPSPTLPEFNDPKKPTASELKELKNRLQQSGAVQRLAEDNGVTVEAFLEGLSAEDLLRLRANVRLAQGDLPTLQKYVRLGERLAELKSSTATALGQIDSFRTAFGEARLQLGFKATDLAFAFENAASRSAPALRIPVFRSTKDEDVTITLTRQPRFAPLPLEVSLASEGSVDTARKEAKKDEAKQRTYTTTFTGRKRHYFQITAGFLFSGIESSKFGTVDVSDQVDADGDGTAETVTRRLIARTSERPRYFVPAAQIVFHPAGKDVHPDAYYGLGLAIPGIALGTTLTAPANNFTLGLTFEPLPGLHVSGGWLWSQVQVLQDGFQEGQEIPAAASAPIRDRFESGWYTGGMLDVGVFTGFFGKLLGIGG